LQIGVTNLTKNKFELLNNVTSPELPIHTAISASIAIPFIFEPIIINNDIYCDGGVLDNLPIDTVINMYNIIDTNEENDTNDTNEENDTNDKNKENELSIIGFYLINKAEIINKDNYKSIGISQYFSLLTRTLSQCIIDKKKEKTDINKNKYKIITISIPCDIMTFIKLDATQDDINNIINIAYNISSDELKLSN